MDTESFAEEESDAITRFLVESWSKTNQDSMDLGENIFQHCNTRFVHQVLFSRTVMLALYQDLLTLRSMHAPFICWASLSFSWVAIRYPTHSLEISWSAKSQWNGVVGWLQWSNRSSPWDDYILSISKKHLNVPIKKLQQLFTCYRYFLQMPKKQLTFSKRPPKRFGGALLYPWVPVKGSNLWS